MKLKRQFCQNFFFVNQLLLMKLFIKMITGTTTAFEVDPEDTIQSLKEKVFQKQEIPVEQQRLIIQGKELENGHKLKDYKLTENTLINLVIQI